MRCTPLLICSFILAVAGCAKDAPPPQKDPTPAVQKAGLVLGAAIAPGTPSVALADVAKNPATYRGKTITTTGTVTSVCQHMGCWMEMKDDATQAHIKMAGHDFFVPKTASGHKARVQATLVPSADDDEEKECNNEAAQQMGHPLAKLQLEATGVELD
jgi:hypothetical protein